MTELVYIARNRSRTNKDMKYHTDKDCHLLANSEGQIDERTREDAEEHRYSHCQWCAGEVDNTRDDRRDSLRDMIANGEIET